MQRKRPQVLGVDLNCSESSRLDMLSGGWPEFRRALTGKRQLTNPPVGSNDRRLILVTLAPKKHLVLNAPYRRLLVTLRGKNLRRCRRRQQLHTDGSNCEDLRAEAQGRAVRLYQSRGFRALPQ